MSCIASVYVMQSDVGIKVGLSTDTPSRAAALRADIVFDSGPVPNAHAVEARAHRALAKHAIGNEWFGVAPQVAIEAVQESLAFWCNNQPKPISMRFDRDLLARLDAYRNSLKPVPASRTAVIEAFVRAYLDEAEKGKG